MHAHTTTYQCYARLHTCHTLVQLTNYHTTACCVCCGSAGAALLAGWAVGRYLGIDEVTSATYLVSSALCIAAIACLSKQESARTGNALGLIGVTGGVVATLGGLQADAGTYGQVRWQQLLLRELGCAKPFTAHKKAGWSWLQAPTRNAAIWKTLLCITGELPPCIYAVRMIYIQPALQFIKGAC